MSEEPDKTDERMEGLLRRWGAEEAAEHAPQAALPPPRRAAGPGAGLRYAAVAAGALLVGLLVATLVNRPGQPVGLSTRPADDEIANLNADLTKAQRDLAGLRAKLTALEADLQAERLRLQTDLAEMRNERDRHKAAATSAAAREKALKRTLASQQARLAALAAAEKQLARAKLDLAAAGKALTQAQAQRHASGRKLAAAAVELARIGKSYKQALTVSTALEGEVKALKARREATLADLQRAYLARATADERGIRARQVAGQSCRIVERAAEVRSLATSKLARQAVDRLEVVLIRLELLNVDDTEAVMAFAALVRSVRPAETVDEALAAGGEVTKVRAWLLEARLILTGAGRVG